MVGEFPSSDSLIRVSALPPRLIEYAIAGCMPVLLESHFDGLLDPHTDYYPIKHDLTGLAGLKEVIEDKQAAQKIIHNFQQKIASYKMFSIENLSACIENALETKSNFLTVSYSPMTLLIPNIDSLTSPDNFQKVRRRYVFEALFGLKMTNRLSKLWIYYKSLRKTLRNLW